MGSAEDHIDHEILLSDQLHSVQDPWYAGISGDPQIPPRIGDQYQVKLPSLEINSGKQSSSFDGTVGVDCSLRIYSNVPIYWVNTKENKPDTETRMDGSPCTDQDPNTQVSNWCKNESLNGSFHQVGTGNERCKGSLVPRNQDVEGFEALPGLPAISLEDDELESFLLALYIFGKNLRLVEKFLQSRKMGDILSFYYGKFYRSHEFHRWSECKKSKSRRCILGHRIFTGWRQHELLSRLLPITQEESKSTLLEVTKTFTEGFTTLEDYVLKVKGIVGMKALVEAVGVGKGRLDLTGIALDRTRANTLLSSRSEVVGKDFSSLTTSEIINLLTGNFRLSKQRSNDLFWEAVWPRLLAKGWHSEQPRRKRCVTFKQNLVFLVPGVKKFSRRKLTRGNHYFDSVSDVLHEVTSDPRLLELEIDGCKNSSLVGNEEYSLAESVLVDKVKLNNVNLGSSDLMRFTVVDTSLVEGGPSSIRQLRCLPVDHTVSHTPSSHSDETCSSGSEEQESADVFMKDEDVFPKDDDDIFTKDDEEDVVKSQSEAVMDGLYCKNERKILLRHSDYLLPLSDDIHVNRDQEIHQYGNLLDQKSMKELNYQMEKKTKHNKPVYMSPLSKRRRLVACKYAIPGNGTCDFLTGQPVNEASRTSLSTNDIGDTKPTRDQPPDAVSKYSCENTLDASVPHSFCSNLICNSTTEEMLVDEKPRTRTLFDLNIPQFSPDFDTGCDSSEEVDNSCVAANETGNCINDRVQQSKDPDVICVDSKGNKNSPAEIVQQCRVPDDICVDARGNRICAANVCQNGDPDGLQVNEVGSEHPNDTSLRRTSTRYRPPTTKVLESLESGFFSLKKERRSRSSRSAKPRTFRARKRCATPSVSPAYLKPENCTLEIRDTML